jgi:hypothetical protein
MKIIEAINRTDSTKHNAYSQSEKVAWLSTLDSMVKRLVIDTHESMETIDFTGYGPDVDPETELLIPAPFDEAYLRWLEAQIDYANGEYSKYNNSIDMFNTAWTAYQNWYNRNHMPKGKRIKYFEEPVPTPAYQSANSVAKITIKEV